MIHDIELQDLEIPSSGLFRFIMFYGKTCNPCKLTMPNYEETVRFFESKGCKIQFCRLHAWESDQIREICRTKWNVNGVPSYAAIYENKYIVHSDEGGGDVNRLKNIVNVAIDQAFKNYFVRF